MPELSCEMERRILTTIMVFSWLEPQAMLNSINVYVFPTLQSKMGSLFKPMLPLTHIQEQELSVNNAKLSPPSQTDSPPYSEFPPTTPLLSNGEPVWVSHSSQACLASWLFFIILFILILRYLNNVILMKCDTTTCACFDISCDHRKSRTMKNSPSAETLPKGRDSVHSEDVPNTESQVLEYSDQLCITSFQVFWLTRVLVHSPL